jgi:hypothetical protein
MGIGILGRHTYQAIQSSGCDSKRFSHSPLNFRFPRQEQVDEAADNPEDDNQDDADEAGIVREIPVLNAMNKGPDPEHKERDAEHSEDAKHRH